MTVVTASSLSSTATAQASLLFNWSLATTNTSFSASPTSNFAPQGLELTSSQASLAHYFINAWNQSDRLFAPLFGGFSQLTAGGSYTAALDTLSPKATIAQATALANSASSLLGAAMSCPVFVDQGTLLGEDNCAWAKFTGAVISQYATSDTQGYRVTGTTYRIGAQHEVAPQWYLGASFGYGSTWATMDGGSSGMARYSTAALRSNTRWGHSSLPARFPWHRGPTTPTGRSACRSQRVAAERPERAAGRWPGARRL